MMRKNLLIIINCTTTLLIVLLFLINIFILKDKNKYPINDELFGDIYKIKKNVNDNRECIDTFFVSKDKKSILINTSHNSITYQYEVFISNHIINDSILPFIIDEVIIGIHNVEKKMESDRKNFMNKHLCRKNFMNKLKTE